MIPTAWRASPPDTLLTPEITCNGENTWGMNDDDEVCTLINAVHILKLSDSHDTTGICGFITQTSAEPKQRAGPQPTFWWGPLTCILDMY